ncbi:MAG: glycosyltransferase family 2 protein [Nonlabens sp.]
MISVCIPVYNYSVTSLVSEVLNQFKTVSGNFELLVYDDCSTDEKLIKENGSLGGKPNITYKVLKKNIGRSKIRNLLMQDARYNYVLFLDADVSIYDSQFLSHYVNSIKQTPAVVSGGITYQVMTPQKEFKLRWSYGKKREALKAKLRQQQPHLRLLTLNFLISKKCLNDIRFNENVPNLRHEDTLFAYDLKINDISVLHIDNPVRHEGLEENEVYLQKELTSSRMLAYFMHSGLLNKNFVTLSKKAEILNRFNLITPLKIIFRLFKRQIHKNLTSSVPIIKLFDLYRLIEYVRFEEEIKTNENESLLKLFKQSSTYI